MSDKNFKAAQRKYDNMLPPEEEWPQECEHEWESLEFYFQDEIRYDRMRCKNCKEEKIV